MLYSIEPEKYIMVSTQILSSTVSVSVSVSNTDNNKKYFLSTKSAY